jgi:hypothetical protein
MQINQKSLLPCFLIVLLTGCDKDRYHTDEFRCSINGERVSSSYYKPGTINKTKPKIEAELDSTGTVFSVEATLGNKENEFLYSVSFKIDNFKGKGVYTAPGMTAGSSISSSSFQPVFLLDSSYDVSLEISNFDKDKKIVVGYFHFVAVNSFNERMFITNGRFNMRYD